MSNNVYKLYAVSRLNGVRSFVRSFASMSDLVSYAKCYPLSKCSPCDYYYYEPGLLFPIIL